MKKYIPILPTFDREQSAIIDSQEVMKDTTFYTWLKHMRKRAHSYSSWNDDQRLDAEKFMVIALTSFCADQEKIKGSQDIFKAFVNTGAGREFLSFIGDTRTHNIFSEYTFTRRNHSKKMNIEDASEYLMLLSEQIQKLSSSPVLLPYVKFVDQFSKSKEMVDGRDFLEIFKSGIEFKTHMSKDFDDNIDYQIDVCKSFPKNSYKFGEVARSSISWAHATDVVFTSPSGEITNISSKDYLADWQDNANYEIHLQNKMIADALGISVQEYLENFLPGAEHPFAVTMKFSAGKVIINISESESQLVREKRSDNRKPRILTVPKNNATLPERTDQQKEVLGRDIIMHCDDDLMRRMRELFFRPNIVRLQKTTAILESFLSELHYIVISADYWLMSEAALYRTIFPKVLSQEDNRTLIVDGINPTLIHTENGLHVVANTIDVDVGKYINMVTGPNQNGKTKFINMGAIFQIWFQAGWPIIASHAEMSPKTDLRVHYIHSGTGIKGESRFSFECVRARNTFSKLGPYPLILMDETYTGTNPIDGTLLLGEILQASVGSNLVLFLASHFHDLIPLVDELPNAQNLHCAVGPEKEFTYKILKGSSKVSNALEVAAEKGVRKEDIEKLLHAWKNPPKEVAPSSDKEDDLPF